MPVQEKNDFVILYGSQTGQAEAISEEIYERSFKEGFKPVRYMLGDIEKRFSLEKLKYVVVVCSTTGEGEPPDNAAKFVRRIRKKTLSSRYLQHLSFAVLGLGDSNYTNFCNCPKGIISRFLELGATSFYESGYGDDAVGLEEVVEPWIEGLFPVLRQLLKNNTDADTDVNSNLNTLNHGDKELVSPLPAPSQQQQQQQQQEQQLQQLEQQSLTTTADREMPLCSEEDLLNLLNEDKPNLRYSVLPLSESTLKIPSAPPPFLEIVYLDERKKDDADMEFEYPGAATSVKDATISQARQLTFDSSVKKALELELDVKEFEFDFQPGDSFGIVCMNKKHEVDYLVERLQIGDDADKPMTLEILNNTTKKSAAIPAHIRLPSTLRDILTKNVDFRSVPRKALIRLLAEYATDPGEKRRLQELCSVQGSSDYATFVRGGYVGLVQLLQTFPSCTPPVIRVIELLPQLLPREYSIASYRGKPDARLRFVFNVIELPEFVTRKRFGLCTSWLDSATSDMRSCDVLEDKLKTLTLEGEKVPMYFRRPTGFRFPDDPSQPLIMIGPGTGVAPFIGFLEKRETLRENDPTVELGTALLFFGCRYRGKDDLYRSELQEFKDKGILSELYTSYSRDEPILVDMKYVQHNILKHKQRVLDLLFERGGAVFICGDAKFMGRDVTNAFTELIEEYKGVEKVEAIKILNGLRDTKQFLEDVWT